MAAREVAALSRLALLQQNEALRTLIPWRDACAYVRLTASTQTLIRLGLVTFSGRPGTLLFGPDLWAIRVTSRGYDVLPARVRVALVLGAL